MRKPASFCLKPIVRPSDVGVTSLEDRHADNATVTDAFLAHEKYLNFFVHHAAPTTTLRPTEN
eukprot:395297-Prorocentrum_lima.AAC.1